MQTEQADRIQNLWGPFDTISAELATGKHRLREGRLGEAYVN
jgi:hypothetical protein